MAVLVTGAFLYMYWDYLPSWSPSHQTSPVSDDSDSDDQPNYMPALEDDSGNEDSDDEDMRVGDDGGRMKVFDDEDLYVGGGGHMKEGVKISFIESLSILKELVKVELDRVIIE